jgi:large subunit ribosomal protein L6
MSRIGKKAIVVPSGVKVSLSDHTVQISGPKGELKWRYPDSLTVEYDDGANEIRVSRAGDESRARALHGMARALIANMIEGVNKGFEKKLEIYGTGYSCKLQGKQLLLNVGYMGRGIDRGGKQREAQFFVDIPQGLTVTVEVPAARGDSDPAKLTITGPDKQQVGQFAAEVRAIRPPEPYKGKGIRYADEHVKRKQGKAFASGG